MKKISNEQKLNEIHCLAEAIIDDTETTKRILAIAVKILDIALSD